MAAPTVIARCPDELSLFSQDAQTASQTIPGVGFITHPKGLLMVVITPDSVEVYKPDGMVKLVSLPESGVVLADISPLAAYVCTVTKPVKDENGQPGKNLKVWEVSSGRCVLAVPQKQVSKDSWPTLHWGGDDSCVGHCVTNTVHMYRQSDNFESYGRVTVRGVAGLALSPCSVADPVSLPEGAAGGPSPTFCAFVPEIKGSPAFAGLYSFEGAAPGSTLDPTPSVKKSFFRTSGAQIHWNSKGSAVLVLGFTDFDVTNQSYYGEQKLHYLPSNPAKADLACTVALPKEGPVHDVQWSPNGDYFAVVAGFIPAKVVLYDADCKPVYDLGSGPYNIVRWNPFGRFLAVAGFGNLPGDIVFYDKKASGTCRQMGAVRSPAVDAQWSPDGRHLLTATVAPRLRVDNNYKILTYYGKQVSVVQFPTLFQARWMPAPPGSFEDRPQSPERLAAEKGAGGTASGPALAPKPAGYTPPHLRGAAGGAVGGAPKPQFSLGFDPADKPGRIASAAANRPGSGKPVPPGAEFLQSSGKAASKNAKKRANKKKAGDPGGSQEGDGDNGREEAPQAAAPAAAQAPKPSTAPEAQVDVSAADVTAKRVRNLQKKLREIEKLKERQAKGDALEPEQLNKISTEASIVAEIKELGA